MLAEAYNQIPLRTYDISFDSERALEAENLEQFTSYIATQMETHLGERFNVSLSRYEYDVKDGKLWGKDMGGPFLNSLKKGRDYRLVHGSIVDRERESAEVEGFEKIEALLADDDTPDGTMMLSISPPGLEGSVYTHNFYDVFVARRREDGVRYVEARRYASSLVPDQYREKVSAFASIEIDETDVSASFLRSPIPIQNTLTPDDLHHYMHKEHDFMDEAEFERVKASCNVLITAYAQAVREQPKNDVLHRILFNAVLNKADDIAFNKEKINVVRSVRDEVELYAFQPVREVMTGCGASGGYEIGVETMNAPFSVSTYIPDKYGERTFNCPSCKKENIRPYNKLLPQCLHCGSDKVAC